MSTTDKIQVVGPVPAECPEDGGKWAIFCEHRDEQGTIIEASILQDTNKARLASWKRHTDEWCSACQELRDYGTLEFVRDPYNPDRVEVPR